VLLTLAGVYQFFDAMYIVYNGGLRGAGDTFVPALVVGTLCWVLTVGGGYLMARYYREQLGVLGPWLAAMAYGIVVGLFLMLRFRGGRWRAINLEAPSDSAKLPGFEVVAPAKA
jgi:MATE family multidrug resistance protein